MPAALCYIARRWLHRSKGCPDLMSSSIKRRLKVWAAIAVYAATIIAPLLFMDHLLVARNAKTLKHPLAGELLPVKTDYYRTHADEYDLVFIGDSRTFINLQPNAIDAVLGTHSINLGMWGHYFATQYGQLSDIIDRIPKNSTVIWSIGHRNFQPVDELVWKDFYPPAQRTPFNPNGRWFIDRYPVHAKNAPSLLSWGYPWQAVKRNLIRFGPFGEVLEQAREWRYTINRRRNNPVAELRLRPGTPNRPTEAAPQITPPPPAQPPMKVWSDQDILDLRRRYIADEQVGDMNVIQGDGAVNSIVVYTLQGSYLRIETDPAFFRTKQRELTETIRQERKPDAEITEPYAPSPPFWRNFLAILDLFKTRGVHVVVNELEEAPFIYAAWGGESEMRRFMEEQVIPAVTARGFPYIRPDFSQVRDEHYFDMDHLNAEGVRVFTPRFAEALRPHLRQKE